MGEGLIAVSGTAGYIGIALVSYRLQFKRMWQKYKAWQAEAPDQLVKYYTEYGGSPSVTRNNLDFTLFWDVMDIDGTGDKPDLNEWRDFRPAYMLGWPLVGAVLLGRMVWVKVLNPFLHPKELRKSKVDYRKIDRLEKEFGLGD